MQRRRSAGRWAATLVATVASLCVLDAVAAAGGVVLVASGVFAHVGARTALVLLAASYVTWGLALRVALAQNARLLATTGVSTNAFSKAAFEVARQRGAGERTQRAAASAGYLLTEAVKELPYYVGALGWSALGSAAPTEALVFVAGSNLGAALYEWTLARATRVRLHRAASATAATAAARPAAARPAAPAASLPPPSAATRVERTAA